MMEQAPGRPAQQDGHPIASSAYLLTCREAVELLNVSDRYLASMLDAGQIRLTDDGLISQDDLLAYKARSDADADRALNELVQLSQEMRLYD